MDKRIARNRLQVADVVHQFIQQEALPGTGIDADAFWSGLDALIHDLTPRNRALLAERDRLQAELDTWYRAHPGPRSEEHTSELQSLMRISYAVFCLKKKKK